MSDDIQVFPSDEAWRLREAIIYLDGAQGWYKDVSNNLYFFQQGFLQSIDDQPAIKYHDNSHAWYHQGMLHRENLPAKKTFSTEAYFRYNKKHRLDGCAVLNTQHALFFEQWWINGCRLSKDVFESLPRDKENKIHADDVIIFKESIGIFSSECSFYCWHGHFCDSAEEFLLLKLQDELPQKLGQPKPKL